MQPSSSSTLDACDHLPLLNNCRHCGIFLHPTIRSYKSTRYSHNPDSSTKRHLRKIKQSLDKFYVSEEGFRQVEDVFQFTEKVASKFDFSIETFTLGIYLFTQLLKRKYIDENQSIEFYEFYSSVCLILAAKSIQLDKNVPYLSRYQRYAQKTHSKDDYQRAQAELFVEFDFDLQIPTFATFIDYYLNNGILFEDDKMKKEEVWKLEDRVFEIAMRYVRNGEFACHEQDVLAARIILLVRQQFRLGWNPIIEKYSELSLNMFEEPGQHILRPKTNRIESSPESIEYLDEKMSEQTSFRRSTPSKIQFSEKLTQRIIRSNQSLKVTSPLSFLSIKSVKGMS